MKIYKISQNINNNYDTFDSAVVTAKSEEEARLVHPYSEDVRGIYWCKEKKQFWNTDSKGQKYLQEDKYGTWTNEIDKIKVEFLGNTNETESKVIVSSFNAG